MYTVGLTKRCSHCGKFAPEVGDLIPFFDRAFCDRCFNFQMELSMRRGGIPRGVVEAHAWSALQRWSAILGLIGG